MSESKYSGLTKIKVGDKIGTQKEWKEMAAKKTGLTVDEVGFALKAAFGDSFEVPEGVDKDKAKLLGKLVSAAKADFKSAKEMQEALNKQRAEEAEELKKRKEHMAALFKQQEETSLVVAEDFAGNLQNVVASSVEDYFAIDAEGSFILKDDDNAEEAFAAGFSRLRTLFEKSRQLGGGFALYEARLAIAAEEKFGKEWPNYFSGTDENDVRRITRNMKAIKTFTDLGFSVGEIPIGTLLALTEVKYDKEDPEKNKAIKAQVIQEFIEASEKAGGPLNQKDALKIVRSATEGKRTTSMIKWNYIFIYADGMIAGANQYDEKTEAVLVIDKNQRVVIKNSDGSYSYKPIPAVGGDLATKDAEEISKAAAEKAAAEEAAKKAAAEKAAAKAEKASKKTTKKAANVIPMNPEPEVTKTEDNEDDDDGLGSLEALLA